MIDSHTHIDLCDDSAEKVVEQAVTAGVNRLLTVGTDPESCKKALELAEKFPQVYAAIGRHPNAAAEFDASDMEELRQAAQHPRCLAVGETGFDFYRVGASDQDQQRAFIAQIELAVELSKPLVIHSRSADEQTLATLSSYASQATVVLHCFSMPARLQHCLEQGYWLSFAGNTTYPSAKDLMQAAREVPLDRILLETDAPYLAPQPVRGQPNRPANIVQTANLIAQARGITYSELEQAVERNAAEVFGW